jgi:tRNA dimethylallyltransferase
VARLTELRRAGIEPHADAELLWTTKLRRPTRLVGLALDRAELAERIDARVDAMVAAGIAEEVRAAAEAGASRTARAALGFEALLDEHDASPSAETVEAIKSSHRAYARRQLTWMRRMEGVEVFDRTGMSDQEVAERVVEGLG